MNPVWVLKFGEEVAPRWKRLRYAESQQSEARLRKDVCRYEGAELGKSDGAQVRPYVYQRNPPGRYSGCARVQHPAGLSDLVD